VQGGDHAAQAERRAEVAEALEAMPKKLVKVAERLRGYRLDTTKGKYVGGLLRGLSGNDLQRSAGLSDRKMATCRKWLKGIMATCRV
jgi:hypothetical protein